MQLRQVVVAFRELTTKPSHSVQIRPMPSDTVATRQAAFCFSKIRDDEIRPIAGTARAMFNGRSEP